jgi:hypothetical protein
MRLPSPGFLLNALVSAAARFPGAMLAAVIGVIGFFGMVGPNVGHDEQNLYTKIWLCGAMGLPLLTALTAFAESRDMPKAQNWALQSLGLLCMLGCWFWLDPGSTSFGTLVLPRYAMLLAVSHLAVAVAPYLNARSVRDFWEYNRQLFANLAVGALFSGVLFMGTSLALLAVDNLFGAHIDGRTYVKLFGFWAGIFNTAYFLYHFPSRFEAETSSYNFVLHNLCKYILIPIVILYFVILYAYGAKIGIEWSLPHGWVSSLVLGFSVAGIFTYLLNFYLPHEDRSLIVVKFKKWFWWVVLPLTGLLFIAIGKRISDYGVTEERFLVAQLGLWLALTCAYFLFSRKENIKFIPISLAIVGLSWAFGPLSALAVSKRSQTRILTSVLAKNDRFENGKIKSSTTPVTMEDQQKISSCIHFLEYRQGLRKLLPEPIDSALLESYGLLKWLGVDTYGNNSETKSLNISTNDPYEPLEVKGYDRAFRIEFSKDFTIPTDKDGDFFKLAENAKDLEWATVRNGVTALVETSSLTPMIEQWAKHIPKDETYAYVSLPLNERSFDWKTDKAQYRVIVDNVQLEADSSGLHFAYGHGWVLVSSK